jgi:hypothetical protein
VAVAGQPGDYRLVAHDFSILVSAPGQGHDEEPGLEDFASLAVGDERTGTEVDLGHLANREVEHDGRGRRGGGRATEESVQRMHAACVAVLSRQSLAHGADRYALLVPGQNVLAVRLHRGRVLRELCGVAALCRSRWLVVRRDQCIVGYRTGGIQPVLPGSHGPYLRYRAPPHSLCSGNPSIGFTQPQALDDLSYFEPRLSGCHP